MSLPRWPVPCEGTFHQPAGRAMEVGGGGGQMDMVLGREVPCGLANGAAHRQPDRADPYAQARHGGGASGEQLGRVLRGRGRVGGEHAERAQVHRVLRGFQAPERQVERCEQVFSQGAGSRVGYGEQESTF